MARRGDARATLIEANNKFIRQLASVYCYNGHYLLDYEELVAEGYLLASQLTRVLTAEEFTEDFRAALRNRYKNLLGEAFCQRRKGNWVMADLSEAYNLIGEDGVEEIYQREKLDHLREMLSPMAKQVLRELLHPSDKTVTLAKEEYKEKIKQRKTNGIKRTPSYKITNGVISRSLGLTPTQLRVCILKIKDGLQDSR